MIITKDGKLMNTAEDNAKVDEFLNRQPKILIAIRETGEKFAVVPFICGTNDEKICTKVKYAD